MNAGKCKVMRTNAQIEDKVKIGNEEVEEVEEFVYLGATVTKDGGGTEDTKKCLNKARGTFFKLVMRISKTQTIGQNTKINLCKTLMQPVLLYGCKAWKIIQKEEKRLDRFQFKCLRKILRIWWPQCVRNETVSGITGVNKISDEIQRK